MRRKESSENDKRKEICVLFNNLKVVTQFFLLLYNSSSAEYKFHVIILISLARLKVLKVTLFNKFSVRK